MSDEKPGPLQPIASSDVPWSEWSDVPRFAVRYKHLSLAALGETYHVGVAIEELAPGKQSAPFHYHFAEEEHVYLLEGTLTVRLGPDSYQMKPGGYVCFPAGQRAGHCLVNNSAAPCRYVIVGERIPNEVAVYPDANKVLVRQLGRLFDLDITRGYWEGETTGLPAGAVLPSHIVPKPITSTDKANPPIASEDVAWNDEGPGTGTRFGGRSRPLTYAAVGEDYHVGMVIESPAPGRRLWPKHYHMLEEEHALILEGEVTLLLGEERHRMTAGDYVCFPAGQAVGHSFLNSGPGPCSYLIVGERNPNDVCVYPDSNKVAVSALRTRNTIFDMAASKRYWDGEHTG
ncbi:MAG TPA: cupin domain-containing protein [Dongiaceae bacterium]|nr:cupin domain-containing protein [Dongiaceae bacterium]